MRASFPKVLKCDFMTVGALIVLVSIGATTTAQERPALFQPYGDSDAYEIYNLLLPQEESYAFAKDALMIQENTVSRDISGACLKPRDAQRFRGAIAGYERVSKCRVIRQYVPGRLQPREDASSCFRRKFLRRVL